MNRFFAIAAVLLATTSSLATTSAYAGDSYSFDVGGRTVHIDAPSDCRSTSCVSVSIPGIYESGPRRSRRDRDQPDRAGTHGKTAEPQVANPAPPAVTPAPATPNAKAEASLEPANGAPAPAATPSAAVAPAATASAAQPARDTDAQPQPATPAPAAATVVATAPVAAPVQQQQTPAPVARPASSPLGVWLTEEKEGKVRIEQCGTNLCGYAVNAKTNANGDKVLINMKSVNDVKWSGRIFDPKSGSTYDSTIALKNADSLRVQGCAFGGMFCGGQTWSRVD